MKTLLTTLILIFSFNHSPAQSPDLLTLADWMQGNFDSHDQHLKDTANYFDIHLEIVPIWKDRSDAIWLYVEQAVATMREKPYRQRVYKLTENGAGVFESKIYLLEDPLRFVNHIELFEKLNPDSITEKPGCSVFLKKIDKKTFKGGTDGKNCSSDRKGASYASSEVLITETMLESWDRGFDEKDSQVWGAELGAYRFIKR